MRSSQQILVINHRSTTVKSVPIFQNRHPNVLIHLRLLSPNNPVMFVGQTTTSKKKKIQIQKFKPYKEFRLTAWRTSARSGDNFLWRPLLYPNSTQQPFNKTTIRLLRSHEFLLNRWWEKEVWFIHEWCFSFKFRFIENFDLHIRRFLCGGLKRRS